MQQNFTESIEKIYNAFNKMQRLPKLLLKYGSIFFLFLLFSGTVLILLNNTFLSYSSYMDLVSKSIVKISFSIAAEVIIGSLLLDYVFKK